MRKIKFNKKGELTTKEIIEFILAAAGIVILVILMYKLIFPFDKNAEAAKGYFDVLKEQIGVADKNAVGEIYLWDSSTSVYIIYFDSKDMLINSSVNL